MPKLLKCYWRESARGLDILCVEKSRGKISLTELQEYLLYEARIYGHWAILLHSNESACDVGWPTEPPKGDRVYLYGVSEGQVCPVCHELTPPEYCPHCGERVFALGERSQGEASQN